MNAANARMNASNRNFGFLTLLIFNFINSPSFGFDIPNRRIAGPNPNIDILQRMRAGIVYTMNNRKNLVAVIGRPRGTSIMNNPKISTHSDKINPNTIRSRQLISLKRKKLHRYPGMIRMAIPPMSFKNSIGSIGTLLLSPFLHTTLLTKFLTKK